jgi:hypothetical protein
MPLQQALQWCWSRLEEGSAIIERKRIQIHLERTEKELRAKDVSHMSEQLQERREQMLDALHEYQENGEFPRNDRFLTRTPFFIGSDGTPCAVGHLMLADGEDKLVEQIVEEDNFIYLEDVEDGRVLDWIKHAGLTQDEAARIQPSYGSASAVLAEHCGPIACSTARMGLAVGGGAAFLGLEWLGYRLVGDMFPDNALKRRGALAYFTVSNAAMVVALGVFAYALLP